MNTGKPEAVSKYEEWQKNGVEQVALVLAQFKRSLSPPSLSHSLSLSNTHTHTYKVPDKVLEILQRLCFRKRYLILCDLSCRVVLSCTISSSVSS